MFTPEGSGAGSGVTELESDAARAAGMRSTRWRLLWGGGLSALASLGAIVAAVWPLMKGAIGWMRSLPDDTTPTLGLLLKERSDLLWLSAGGGLLCAAVAGASLYWVFRILGPGCRPPAKLMLVVTGGPLALCTFALVTTSATGALAATLVGPFMLGGTLLVVPLQVFVLAYAMLGLAVRQLEQSPKPVELEDLPGEVADYFADQEAEALEAGLLPLGDFSFEPEWHKYRRVWMAPNGSYFLDASWAYTGNGPRGPALQAVGVCSATTDGRYFETVDQKPIGSLGSIPDDDPEVHLEFLPREPVVTLVEDHAAAVAEWCRERGCLPLEFSANDVHTLSRYGMAAVMRRSRNDFLWLANPYADQPLPELPGRAWAREEVGLPVGADE